MHTKTPSTIVTAYLVLSFNNAHALSVPEESDDDLNSVEDDPLSDSADDSSDDDQL